jgi:hypothetical protein
MTKRTINVFGLPKSIGKGRVLMHNHIRHTRTMPCGWNGFRAWTDTKVLPGFKPCGCGYAGLPHYSLNPDYRCEQIELNL